MSKQVYLVVVESIMIATDSSIYEWEPVIYTNYDTALQKKKEFEEAYKDDEDVQVSIKHFTLE